MIVIENLAARGIAKRVFEVKGVSSKDAKDDELLSLFCENGVPCEGSPHPDHKDTWFALKPKLATYKTGSAKVVVEYRKALGRIDPECPIFKAAVKQIVDSMGLAMEEDDHDWE